MTTPSDLPTRAQQFGQYVAAAARAAGYDIDGPRGGGKKALAEAAGMSHASVSRMLSGQTIPDPTFFEPLARALRVPLPELLVRSGIISPGALRSDSNATPAASAHRLGIRNPRRVAVFETMVEHLLEEERRDSESSRGTG